MSAPWANFGGQAPNSTSENQPPSKTAASILSNLNSELKSLNIEQADASKKPLFQPAVYQPGGSGSSAATSQAKIADVNNGGFTSVSAPRPSNVK